MLTILAFVVALGTLIVIHELGHYWVARWCGVKVLRFCVGFGRPIWLRRYGPDQTEWAIAAIPLGGYVKMLDEREAEQPIPVKDLPRAFNRQVVWKRILIVLAGPLANLLLAVALYIGLVSVGNNEPRALLMAPPAQSPAALAGIQLRDEILEVNGEPVRSWNDALMWMTQSIGHQQPIALKVKRFQSGGAIQILQLNVATQGLQLEELEKTGLRKLGLGLASRAQAVLGEIIADDVAAKVGLRRGDVVQAVNGQRVSAWQDWLEMIKQHPGKVLQVQIVRGTELLTFNVTPRAELDQVTGQQIGRIGVAPDLHEMVFVQYRGWQAIQQAVLRTWQTALFSLRMLGKMLVGEVSLKNLSGPITIADYAGQTAKMGWFQYVSFIAVISISLGVLNLLPIPMLDGGHLMYYVLEVIRGRPLPEAIESFLQRAGLTLLLFVMGVAFFNDLVRQNILHF